MPPKCTNCENRTTFIIRHTIDEKYVYEDGSLGTTEYIEELHEEWIECDECGSREVVRERPNA